jgi:hypothetical protein
MVGVMLAERAAAAVVMVTVAAAGALVVPTAAAVVMLEANVVESSAEPATARLDSSCNSP